MKKVQLNRYNVALRVQHYLKQHADLYAGNIPMVSTAKILDSKIAELETQMALQYGNVKGLTIDKREIRKELENRAFALSSGCCVYAITIGNSLFYKRCYYTKSDLLHMRDTDFRFTCGDLLDNVTEHASDLLPFNITPEMIAEFGLLMVKFADIVDAPREAITQKSEATAKIQPLLTEIMNLIRNLLDKVMVSMIPTQPQFVSVYKNLRKIKKAPAHKRSLTVIVRDAETFKPLAQATMETGNKIKRKTGAKGMSFVTHLPEGNYKLGVSHPGYDSQSQKYTVISGNATKVEVLMKKTVVDSVDRLIANLEMTANENVLPSFVEVMTSLAEETRLPYSES